MATVTVDSPSPFAVRSTGVSIPATIAADLPKTGDTVKPIGFVMLGLAALSVGYLVMTRCKA